MAGEWVLQVACEDTVMAAGWVFKVACEDISYGWRVGVKGSL